MEYVEQSYSKWIRDQGGNLSKRYSAIDPADFAIKCTCGRDGCHRARLLKFREHIAELFRALRKVREEDIAVWEPSGWSSVLYALQMAASIEDVDADTGYVEDPMVFAVCETTIDYENAQSEMASKYVAAAIIFNFLWQAYEAVVAITARDELVRLNNGHRYGERGRRLLESRPQLTAHFRGTGDLVKLALLQCRKGGLMSDRCDSVEEKYGNDNLAAAAELAREFRNFVFHGGDEAPAHEHWGDALISRCRIYRFYSVSRLILYLIQSMCWIEHSDEAHVIEYGPEDEEIAVRAVFEGLQFTG
jgi:hypothetical protein